MAALGTLYTPVNALDFHRRLLSEMVGSWAERPRATVAAREQRKRGDGQLWPKTQERSGREKTASYVAVGELGGAIRGEWPT